jgi:hypothetical protein
LKNQLLTFALIQFADGCARQSVLND